MSPLHIRSFSVASPAFGFPSIYNIICFFYLFCYERERERGILHFHSVLWDSQWSHITPQQRSQVEGG
jgi:hypothetical protein